MVVEREARYHRLFATRISHRGRGAGVPVRLAASPLLLRFLCADNLLADSLECPDWNRFGSPHDGLVVVGVDFSCLTVHEDEATFFGHGRICTRLAKYNDVPRSLPRAADR